MKSSAKMNRVSRALLLLGLEVVLLIPACWDQQVDRGSRSIDDYWAETKLQDIELESHLKPEVCSASLQDFLGCINAVSLVAERYNLVVGLDGTLQAMDPAQIEARLTEKEELSLWADAYKAGTLKMKNSPLELWKQLEKKYVSARQRSAAVATGINGYLSVTRDPHTYILPLAFYDEVVARSDSRQSNLGFLVKRTKGGAIVRKVYEQSPADHAGIKRGDRLLRVNGIDVTNLHPTQLAEALKAKAADRLPLLLERTVRGQKVEKYVEVIKSDFIFPSVMSHMMEGRKNVGILTVHKFGKETCLQAKSNLISLIEQGARGLVLDLRDNPGGQVEEAACLLGLFVEKGLPLFETRYMDPLKPADRYESETDPIYRGGLAVLINSGTASAAEIVAGVLKDLGRAMLVGERTFGKGTFQDGRLWGHHSKVAIFETEGMYYFPSGWTPQLVGIEPDIEVLFDNVETHREADLFYFPYRPRDIWAGPQSLTWLQLYECGVNSPLWPSVADAEGADPQVLRAQAWLACENK